MAGTLIPAPGTAVVRMYRIGHGDCFLLALPGRAGGEPSYVLIDCGYKPGSPAFINTTARQITADIEEATGGRVDLAIVTHEHQDHVNAITRTNFADIAIGEVWFAWTEDENDDLANELRTEFNDRLLGLLAARNRLQADGDVATVARIDRFLAFELGGDEEVFDPAAARALLGAADPARSKNKQAMKLLKDASERAPKFLRPHGTVRVVPRSDGVRVYVLGPPRNEEQLRTLDPQGDEEFHLAAATPASYFGAAARALEEGGTPATPFAPRYCVSWADARAAVPLFTTHYGADGDAVQPPAKPLEVPSNAPWRRIDRDWLYSAEQLALDANHYTNNTSLVLAFELSPGGKVLLFAADAQRGNWRSWTRRAFSVNGAQVTTRDLLARTVLYKVGHHGSHNATLNGTADADYPNIAWMAHGDYAREFTAMITAVRAWAETQNGWDHPQQAIKDALLRKAGGRVFQTDTDVADMERPAGSSNAEWNDFQARTDGQRLFFDYTITLS